MPKDTVSVFISYGHNDAIIAQALHDELVSVNRDRVRCFLDTKKIQSGRNFEDELDRALEEADWLVCIYTGEQSEYCGYEIGVFKRARGITSDAKDSRLVCLHDVNDLPGVFRNHQNRAILFPPDADTADAGFDENHFYLNAPISAFLKDFYKYQELYVTDDIAEFQRQVTQLIHQSKRITEAFKAARLTDVIADTPTQLLIEVSIAGRRGKGLAAVPDDAEITGTFQSMGLFGLMPPMANRQLPVANWGRLKQVLGPAGGSKPLWIDCLEQDMIQAANGLALSGREISFPKGGKVWRPILSRHRLYEGGGHRFDILFVETLPRQFLGARTTSALLAAIVMASRFRFAYFEEQDRVAAGADRDPFGNDAIIRARQLVYDIERLEHEAMEFGLDHVNFLQSFGEERRALAESFTQNWEEAKRALLPVVRPGPGAAADGDAEAVGRAVETFLRTVERENRRFLLVAIDLYRTEMRARLGGPGV